MQGDLSQRGFDRLQNHLRDMRAKAVVKHHDEGYGDADKALLLLERFITDLCVDKATFGFNVVESK